MLKELCLYLKDCVREELKSSSFRNLDSNKKNKIIELDNNNLVFELDDKRIVELMNLAELNKIDRQLIYGKMFIEGSINRNTFKTPLKYYSLRFERQNDKIIGLIDKENPILNVGAISMLLNNEPEQIDNIINTLMDYINSDELLTVLASLVDLKGLKIDKNKKAIILAKIPDATAGLINELQLIVNNCN